MLFFHLFTFYLLTNINSFLFIKKNFMKIKNPLNTIINIKQNTIYKNENLFLINNTNIIDKKIITISPGGFYGFYLFGIVSFIKDNYNLTDYIFTGASAGSWISLSLCYKNDMKKLFDKIMCKNISNIDSIIELEYSLKYKLLNNFNDNDFDLHKLFVGITTIKNYKILTNIFTDFNSLEDAINACIASSHIPFITSGFFSNKYYNMYNFDGGFSSYPYINTSKPVLNITPNLFDTIKNNKENNKENIKSETKNIIKNLKIMVSLVKKNSLNFNDLYENGYNDALKHKWYFDKIFISKNI